MVIYETWPYELLYDANQVLDWTYGLQAEQRAKYESQAAQAQQTKPRRSRRFR